MRIDLHIHSTASDGSLSPHQILKKAEYLGLGAVAITDHDTLDGVKAVLSQKRPPSPAFLTGIEFSTAPPLDFTRLGGLHILGYGIDVDNPDLNTLIIRQKKTRKARSPEIIDRLRACGLDISMADVHRRCEKNAAPGRPHIAAAMVEKGLVADVKTAFNRFLKKGRPAYVHKPNISCKTAICAIVQAGGVASLAHPGLLKPFSGGAFEQLITTLTGFGLGALEVYYPSHRPDGVVYYKDLCRRLGLLATGGTDFHGDSVPEIQMGSGRGDFCAPFSVYAALAERLGYPAALSSTDKNHE